MLTELDLFSEEVIWHERVSIEVAGKLYTVISGIVFMMQYEKRTQIYISRSLRA